jgi:hypothetical protein
MTFYTSPFSLAWDEDIATQHLGIIVQIPITIFYVTYNYVQDLSHYVDNLTYCMEFN